MWYEGLNLASLSSLARKLTDKDVCGVTAMEGGELVFWGYDPMYPDSGIHDEFPIPNGLQFNLEAATSSETKDAMIGELRLHLMKRIRNARGRDRKRMRRILQVLG